jgi:hypothetical protein
MNELIKTNGGLPTDAELEKMMREDAGAGISQRAEDNLVPRITLLQPLSPLVTQQGQAAGNFVVGEHVIDGKTGFWFQPCFHDQMWLEFHPLDEGGGFVAAHQFEGEDKPPPNAEKYAPFKFRMLDSGNELIHYRQFAGIVWNNGSGLEFVIPFKSTGHTVARDWNTRANQQNRWPDGKPRALYGHVWHVTSLKVQRKQYTWFIIKVEQPTLLDAPAAAAANPIVGDWKSAYLRGRALAAAFKNQEKIGDVDVENEREDAPF